MIFSKFKKNDKKKAKIFEYDLYERISSGAVTAALATSGYVRPIEPSFSLPGSSFTFQSMLPKDAVGTPDLYFQFSDDKRSCAATIRNSKTVHMSDESVKEIIESLAYKDEIITKIGNANVLFKTHSNQPM